MLPSILAKQLQKGIGDYIEATFPMTNEPFKGSIYVHQQKAFEQRVGYEILQAPSSAYYKVYGLNNEHIFITDEVVRDVR